MIHKIKYYYNEKEYHTESPCTGADDSGTHDGARDRTGRDEDLTYTITSVELNSGTDNYDIVFTRSGDAPFDASATTYTTSVHKSSIGQSPGYPGYIHVELADVFELSVSWDSGSNVTFNNNCIYPGGSGKQITYAVSWNDNGYYVTHITMQGMEYTWDDTTYEYRQSFAHSTSTASPSARSPSPTTTRFPRPSAASSTTGCSKPTKSTAHSTCKTSPST